MLWFVICKGDLLLQETAAGTWCVPHGDTPPVKTTRRVQPLPSIDDEPCAGLYIDRPVVAETERPGGTMRMWPLRQTYGMLPEAHYQMAGKAAMLGYHDQNTRFCGVCGAPMRWHTDISKRCTECGKEVWPQLATAIIVRVERRVEGSTPDDRSRDEILLVRARNFRGDYYGLVAGFVETGESLEDCVRREVREETGIEIDDIRYFGSQPWPYPCGLMVGFTARYVSGSVHLQHAELASGGWYRRDNLPHIPDKASIARRLIDEWETRISTDYKD